jgi:uridine kinase
LYLKDVLGWEEIYNIIDIKYFIECDIEICMDRVLKRQLNTGLSKEDSIKRIDSNDRLNAILINETKKYADLIIESISYD